MAFKKNAPGCCSCVTGNCPFFSIPTTNLHYTLYYIDNTGAARNYTATLAYNPAGGGIGTWNGPSYSGVVGGAGGALMPDGHKYREDFQAFNLGISAVTHSFQLFCDNALGPLFNHHILYQDTGGTFTVDNTYKMTDDPLASGSPFGFDLSVTPAGPAFGGAMCLDSPWYSDTRLVVSP